MGKCTPLFETRSTLEASGRHGETTYSQSGVHDAGEASVYSDQAGNSWKEGMMRERVLTQGMIRPLDPKEQLDGFSIPSNMVGVIAERAMRRYVDGKTLLDHRFRKEMAAMEKQRRRNMDLAEKEFSQVILHLRELHNGKK